MTDAVGLTVFIKIANNKVFSKTHEVLNFFFFFFPTVTHFFSLFSLLVNNSTQNKLTISS